MSSRLEFCQGLSWQNISRVDDWLLVNSLMNWNSGVYNVLLKSLTLDNWLDGVMNVVVNLIFVNSVLV